MLSIGLGVGIGAAQAIAVASPTTILMAPWLAANFLHGGVQATNGQTVNTWTALTGPAITAAADGSAPLLDTTNGIHTNGEGRFLSLASTVTIPSAADFDLWALCKRPIGDGIVICGYAASANPNLRANDEGNVFFNGASFSASSEAAFPADTALLLRIGRTGSNVKIIVTSGVEAAMSASNATAAIVLDTLLGRNGEDAGIIDGFSPSGSYLKALRIDTYPAGYTGRTAWRAAVETGTLAGGGFAQAGAL